MDVQEQRAQTAKKVTLVGAGFNLFLAVTKILFGWLGRSNALIADGIHSLSDLGTDALVLLASHFGSRKADIDHPYGHQRIETAATMFLALLLILAGFGIAIDALIHFISGGHQRPEDYVLVVAVLSILVNEGLYHYTIHASKKIKSNLLAANAWHHRSDAASSVVVLIGVIGALMGYYYLDSIAAIIVGLMIIKMGAGLGWASIRELVDTGVPEETLKEIRSAILSVPGVLALHELRTRCMAETIFVDAHILVNPRLSVSEGHYISSKVHEKLIQDFEKIVDVTIHVDPENDELAPLSRNLPPRSEVTAVIMSHLTGKPCVDAVVDIRLHYLEGGLEVNLVLPLLILNDGHDAEQLRKIYLKSLEEVDYICHVQLLFV